MVKMKYLEDEMSAIIAESREACKYLRKLGKIMKTVATHRLKELRHLHAVEKLATWRKTYGFDRLEDGDNHWVHGPLPPMPEQIIASMWSDLNTLKDVISMSGKDGLSQKVKSFINQTGQCTVSFTDEEFARLKRFVERRGRDAAHVTVASIYTAQQPYSPRPHSSELSFDARVCMEKKDKGGMDPERDQLESPSAGMGFETPGQQCPPNGGTGRITAESCLLVGVGSNLGGNIFSPAERVIGTRAGSVTTTPVASSKTPSLQTRRKPKDKKTGSEENKQSDPGGKGEESPP